MAGSPSASWLAAMRAATVEPVVHCSIALDSVTMDFHNSPESMDSTVTGDPLLNSITSVAQSIDPIRRGLQYSEMDLTLVDDGKIRGLVSTQVYYNAVVTVKLGTSGLALSDFEIIFKGNIIRLHPGEGQITVKVRSLDALIADKSNMRAHIKHPFDVVERMLLDSGVASGNIDSTSFTLGTYSGDISHYCFSSIAATRDRGKEDFDRRGRIDPGLENITYMHDYTYDAIDFRTFVDEVMMLTRTTMFVDSAGKVALKHYDSSEAVVVHFTTDDYTDFDQVEEDPLIFNKINASLRSSGPQRFVRKDATSIALYGDEQLDVDVLFLAPNAAYHEVGSVITAEPTTSGFAGTVRLATSQSDEAPSADRPVYWLHRQEVLKSTSAFTLRSSSIVQEYDADGDTSGFVTIPMDIRFNSPATRPFAGNQATEADRFVHDLTATYDFSTYVLDRFSNTAPKVRISTSLEFSYLELGDLVSLDNDIFLSPELSLDGLDSSVKFEIIGKEITALGDSVGVVLDLIYATKTSAPSTSLASELAGKYETMMPNSILQAIEVGLSSNSVVHGLTMTTGSGLTGTVVAGAASGGAGMFRTTPASLDFVATASKDNYVGINLYTGQPIVTAVTTDAAEPALLSGEVRLGKAVAGASSISSVVDLRRIGHVSVDQIDKEAITPSRGLIWNAGFGIYPNNGTAPPGWELTAGTAGTDIIKSTTVDSGRHSLKTMGTGTAITIYSEKIPVDKNRPYRCSAMCQQSGAEGITVTVYWWDVNRAASSVSYKTVVHNANLSSTGAWIPITGVVTPPSDAVFASVRLTAVNGSGVTSYFNNGELTEETRSFNAKLATTNFTGYSSGAAIIFNSELHDYGDDYDTSNGEYTVPESGVYAFSSIISLVGAVGVRGLLISLVGSTSGTLACTYLADAAHGTDEWNDLSIALDSAASAVVKGETVTVQVVWSGVAPAIRHTFTFFSGRQVS